LKTERVNGGALSTACQEIELVSPVAYLRELASLLEQLPIVDIESVIDRLFEAYVRGRGVYMFGNGGSAALASHSACDLGKGTTMNGNRPFRVIALTDNVPLITAWANDASYDDIFAAQLRPLIQPEDIAFAISGSGNSRNVLKALRTAQQAGAANIGLTGFQGGKMKVLCDICVIVPSESMQLIEDSHSCLMHAVFLALRSRIQRAEPVLLAHSVGS
jgi:D-sedoheptulose 7-phosphate isomerase